MKYVMLAILAACAVETGVADQSIVSYGSYQRITMSSGSTDDLSNSNCNYNNTVCKFIGDAGGSTLTGVANTNFSSGDALVLRNDGSVNITIAHNSGSSTLGNRFYLKGGANAILTPGRVIKLFRDLDWTVNPPTFDGWSELNDRAIYGVESVSTPARSLGTAFQPSISRPTLVTYSASADCTISLSGGMEGRVELLSDSANPPTTIRADVTGCKNTGTVVLGISQVMGTRGTATYMVVPGDYVLIRSVNVTGTPTYAITRQTEQTL